MCTSKFCIISLFSYNYHITYLNEDAYYFEKKNDILNDVFNSFSFLGGGGGGGRRRGCLIHIVKKEIIKKKEEILRYSFFLKSI